MLMIVVHNMSTVAVKTASERPLLAMLAAFLADVSVACRIK
jgi:hypothetical protein